MSNVLCHICGGLVDRIGLQPTGVRLCDCLVKIKTLKARIAKLDSELIDARREASFFRAKFRAEQSTSKELEAENQRLRDVADSAIEYIGLRPTAEQMPPIDSIR